MMRQVIDQMIVTLTDDERSKRLRIKLTLMLLKTAQDAINNTCKDQNDDVKKRCDAGTLVIGKDVANAAINNAVAG